MTQMDVSSDRVFVTGGTGFVGSRIVSTLEHRPLRLLRRTPGDSSAPNQETSIGNVTDASSLEGTMTGCTVVVHLVGIIEEQGDATFDQVIRQGTENILAEAKRAGVEHFVHMSALGAQDTPGLGYHTAKWKAEQAVINSGLPYTIFRPSVIFGPGDGFITTLAGVIKAFPVIPVVGNGKTRFQPVQIQDVADAFRAAVDNPEQHANRIHELGGARQYSYEEMLDTIAAELQKKKPKAHVPIGLMKIVVAASGPLPKALRPPVTSEQLKMLGLDNSTADSATARLIGRQPKSLEDGLDYLHA